jgi:amidase/aspartyl-tRNA(Asn)/glutamyl-tRNA(Gln) amidotransferase subunit A
MRRTTRLLSEADLLALADEWGVDVSEREAAELLPRVNRRLEPLDEVYDVRLDGPGTTGDRSWREPTAEEDPYNALVTVCAVPPTDEGALSGLDVGLKDNIAVAGVPMGCGSAVMEGFVPTEDATVVDRLRAAGATIAAKCNLDEFAGGGRGIAVDGRISHPTDTDRFPGGSSGGSAAAVLAGQVDLALGTDTGGSVRVPAALCGLVGVKPTYGLVPIDGVMENTYSLDHVGVISRGVEAAAESLDALAGKTERDPASMAAAGHDDYDVGGYAAATTEPVSPSELTVVRLTEAFEASAPAVAEHVDSVLDALSEAGATVTDVSLPAVEYVDIIKGCVTYPELAQYWRDGGVPLRRGGGGESRDQVGFARRAEAASGELNLFYRGRILTGARLLTAHGGRHYSRALAARRALRERVADALDDAEAAAAVTPTAPIVAPRHEDAGDLDYGITANTRVANVTEQPAVTVPCGTVEELPVGLQLLGRRFDERRLFRVAAGLEGML